MHQLLFLNPGHFHAALVLKSSYETIDPHIHVYAPQGPEVEDFLHRLKGFANREDQAVHWQEESHIGPEYLAQMLADKHGSVVVLAGNNQKKIEYIFRSVDAGLHVLADKPMVINKQDFEALIHSFLIAKDRKVLLYDIMTERFEITNILQKALANIPEVFGELEHGRPDHPSIVIESVHHFSKLVAGEPIVRPAWYFDVHQQGESIVDVTTHLVDLVQWACFPEVILDYERDIEMLKADHWSTALSLEEFSKVTDLDTFPDFLQKNVESDGHLHVLANGAFTYRLKGKHVRIVATWDFEAPPGGGDTHFAILRGTKADVIIRQGKEQNFQPALYVKKKGQLDRDQFETNLGSAIRSLRADYPLIDWIPVGDEYEILIPKRYRVGHEAHFAQVTQHFLDYLALGRLPEWEIPNMLAKYYTTTQAYELAQIV
ncbi:MAG: putative oxidoreductase C-terminal domain-containing protein [Bacteroidota bacterium]